MLLVCVANAASSVSADKIGRHRDAVLSPFPIFSQQRSCCNSISSRFDRYYIRRLLLPGLNYTAPFGKGRPFSCNSASLCHSPDWIRSVSDSGYCKDSHRDSIRHRLSGDEAWHSGESNSRISDSRFDRETRVNWTENQSNLPLCVASDVDSKVIL